MRLRRRRRGLGCRGRRGDAPSAQHYCLVAGEHGEIEQVRRDQDCCTAHARQTNLFERRLDSERVDAVEGFVEEQYRWFVKGSQQHGQSAAHAVREAGGHAVGGAGEVEPLEQVARAVVRTWRSRRSRAVL